MAMSTFRLTTENLTVTIEGESTDFFHQDLYTNAITSLIDQADVSGWVKHHDDFDIPQNFNLSVLKALVRNNVIDWIDDELSYKEALLQIIDELKDHPQLNEKIVFSDEEYLMFGEEE